jgi:hypothetical protein
LLGDAREVLWAVADLLVCVLLFIDAGSDGDQVSADIFFRFLEGKNMVTPRERVSAKEQLARDLEVVYGNTTIPPKL